MRWWSGPGGPGQLDVMVTPTRVQFFGGSGNALRNVHVGRAFDLSGAVPRLGADVPQWLGDTVGFWDGDKLVLSSKYLYPADFTRWSPMTSNQFESVEIWQLKKYGDNVERLEVQATFYDKFAFVKPVNVVYAFRHATDLEKADYRINHWECEQTTNAYLDEKGEFILDNIDGQDMMAWISQGAIADRTQENLGASDNGIALYRRVLRREIKKVEEGLDPMFTFRDPAKNVRIDLPNERKKHHNSEGMRSWIMRTHAAYSPIAEDVIRIFEGHKPAPQPLRVVS